MKKLVNEKIQRRAVLKGTALIGAVLGTATASTQTLADATIEQVAPLESQGYRETEHIREYYRLARF